MAVRRPAPGPGLLVRLSGRFHPRRLRRRLPLAVAVAAAVALAPGLVAGGDPAGPVVPVLVATRDLPAGHAIAEGDLRSRTAPADLVPAGAAPDVADGTVVRAAIGAGEIVLAHRLGAGDGLPDRLDVDQRAVTVPWPAARPPVVVGDTVDVVATSAAEADGAARSATVVSGAVVLAVAEDGVTLAVPEASVAAVLRSVATGVVDLAITPYPS